MDFEEIMLRKISDRNKYCMISIICRILKVEIVKAENKGSHQEMEVEGIGQVLFKGTNFQ